MKNWLLSWPLALLLAGSGVAAADVAVDVDIDSGTTSNVFLDKSAEWDLYLKPILAARLDFGDYWSAGYTGRLSVFTQHQQLFSHAHELFVFANPAWGASGQNELTVELSLQVLRNQQEYAALNLVQPRLLGELTMQPVSWLRWRVGVNGGWRYFYDDRDSSSLDAWVRADLEMLLPSGTTIVPRLEYGVRYFTSRGGSGAGRDRLDQQLRAGLTLRQSLARNCGLRAEYAYLFLADDSGLLERKLSQDQFSYLGEDFLFSGHQANAGLWWTAIERLTLAAAVEYEWRAFAGWPALDAQGMLIGDQRIDTRLGPRAGIELLLVDRAGAMPQLLVNLDYRWLRQWSNHDWYDTQVHVVGITLSGSW